MAQRTVCDRCGAVCKSEENVATLTFDLSRYSNESLGGMPGPAVHPDLRDSTPVIEGEMDLCDECVPIVVGLIKKRVVIDHSNPTSWVEAEAPAPGAKKRPAAKKAAPKAKADPIPDGCPEPEGNHAPPTKAEVTAGAIEAAAVTPNDALVIAGVEDVPLDPAAMAEDFDRSMAEPDPYDLGGDVVEDDDGSIETID